MPNAEYKLRLRDGAGALKFEVNDFISLAYVKRVNAPGMCGAVFPGDHSITSQIADKWSIEVWRKPIDGIWGQDYVGIFREPEWEHDEQSILTLRSPGIMSKLGWRHIMWPAGTSNRSKFEGVKGETIMKTLVDYNAGPNATTGNGRKRTGSITGLTVQSDGANGNTLNWYCFGKNLLDNLQELALVAGGDFDLVQTSPTAWNFRWYTGQLGTDRSASITFSLAQGNMANPKYTVRRLGAKTVAGVWGQGEGSDRDYVTRTGPDYAASNDIEMVVDARDVKKEDTSGLNARGDEALEDAREIEEFSFQGLDTGPLYGVNYFLGDLVTAINPFNDQSVTVKLVAVRVALDAQGNETVAPEFITP